LKYVYPLLSFLISVGFQLFFLFWGYDTPIFMIWVIVYLPFTSFFYSKSFLKDGMRGIPYTLLHSFSLAFSYLMLLYSDTDTFGAAFLLFLWCEVWALLGLIRKQRIPILFIRKKRCS